MSLTKVAILMKNWEEVIDMPAESANLPHVDFTMYNDPANIPPADVLIILGDDEIEIDKTKFKRIIRIKDIGEIVAVQGDITKG